MTPHEAYAKVKIAGKREPELEHIILTDAEIACNYAIFAIRGRWEEAEDIMMTHVRASFIYAKYIIGGRLPDKMHNKILLYAMEYPSDYNVKFYFKFINQGTGRPHDWSLFCDSQSQSRYVM